MRAIDTRPELGQLTDVQQAALQWGEGSLLILGGPGSGKTRLLGGRIARLLGESRDQDSRVLALTFTHRAASEMIARVRELVPGSWKRAKILTFQEFCADVIRQYGEHVEIQPDFTVIYKREDRKLILRDALHSEGRLEGVTDLASLLLAIDRLKTRLIDPEDAWMPSELTNGVLPERENSLGIAYRLYENELHYLNAVDFNSLILEARRLFGIPCLARHFQHVYPYWMIDGFQDINEGQYRLLRTMATNEFKNVVVATDDDQTIFEWNGASVLRSRDFAADFGCEIMQLSSNFRCVEPIIEIANRLVRNNELRMSRSLSVAALHTKKEQTLHPSIRYREYRTDVAEAAGIAEEISQMQPEDHGRTAVLARNSALLKRIKSALSKKGVNASISKRRDEFASPQMRWLVACLRQIERPDDTESFIVLAGSFERFTNFWIGIGDMEEEIELNNASYLSAWAGRVQAEVESPSALVLARIVENLDSMTISYREAVGQILAQFETHPRSPDLDSDLGVWRKISSEIHQSYGNVGLEQFLQGLDLRSKEPAMGPETVVLTTIHNARGREFDTVYLAGMAEGMLPSWHSIKKGAQISMMEEERRVCYVAITRARHKFILSRALKYWNRPMSSSRFLSEMGVVSAEI